MGVVCLCQGWEQSPLLSTEPEKGLLWTHGVAQSIVPSLRATQLLPPGNVAGTGGNQVISTHTAFPSSGLRAFWADSKCDEAVGSPRPLEREEALTFCPPSTFTPPCLGCYHPPLYAGCPRHCGGGQKSWLQSRDSGERREGGEGAG